MTRLKKIVLDSETTVGVFATTYLKITLTKSVISAIANIFNSYLEGLKRLVKDICLGEKGLM